LGYDVTDSNTDVGIQLYPSDHRSVVVEFDVSSACSALDVLNGDCSVEAADFAQLRSAQHADLTGRTASLAYVMGDLNADFRNDHADFVIFKTAYEAANGAGSFARLQTVPEPSSRGLAAFTLLTLPRVTRRGLRVVEFEEIFDGRFGAEYGIGQHFGNVAYTHVGLLNG
jgi:hypothetical protein